MKTARTLGLVAALGALGPISCEGCFEPAPAGVGGACGGETPCAADLVCVDAVCAQGGSVAVGGGCAANDECATLNCVDGRCANGTTIDGDACTSDAQCASGTCADDGHCAAGGTGEGEGEGEGDGGSGSPVDAGPDAGNPFEQPLTEFCSGSGAAVSVGVGAGGSTCAGQLAEDVFQWAICVCDTITSSGASAAISTDSFDSTQGPYDTQTPGDDGHVGVNGTLIDKRPQVSGSMFIGNQDDEDPALSIPSGNAYVTLDLYVHGDSERAGGSDVPIGNDYFSYGAVSGGWTVDGTYYVDPTASPGGGVTYGGLDQTLDIAPILPCPCANPPLDVGAVTTYASTHNDNASSLTPGSAPDAGFIQTDGGFVDGGAVPGPQVAADAGPYDAGFVSFDADVWSDPNSGPATLRLPCGRYYFSSVDRGGGGSADIVAEGRVIISVGGDFHAGGLTVSTVDGAEIDLFVGGDLIIEGGGTFGDSAHPALVRTYVGGDTVTVGAATTFGGNLYAPNAVADFSASGDFYGAIFAQSLLVGANTEVHFDSAIRAAGNGCDTPVTDGGVTIVDGGFDDAGNAIDGGVILGDAGFPPPTDGGVGPPPADGGSCVTNADCGGYICDGTTNTCEQCTGPLQCTAPFVCNTTTGTCVIIGG